MHLPTFAILGLEGNRKVYRLVTTNDSKRARAMFLGKFPEAKILWCKKQEA